MLQIFGRTQRMPENLINVDFEKSCLDEFLVMLHKNKIFPMARKKAARVFTVKELAKRIKAGEKWQIGDWRLNHG